MTRFRIAIIWGDRVTQYMGRRPALGPWIWAVNDSGIDANGRCAPLGFVWVNQWVQT